MTRTRTTRAILAGASAAALAATLTQAPAATAAGKGRIGPGVQMYTNGAQCTANFVFKNGSGTRFVGYAAHCAGLGAATDTNGCQAKSLPLGTRVAFRRGGSLVHGGELVGRGTLVYSSWRAMGRSGEDRPNPCRYNDFALVRVDAANRDQVNPTMPSWGGPVGLNTSGAEPGEETFSYGNSSLRGDVDALSPKRGVILERAGNGWTHALYSVGPGIPGDSGSGYLDARGRALGTLSTLTLAPTPGSNNISTLSKELAYARTHSGFDRLRLVEGSRGFDAGI